MVYEYQNNSLGCRKEDSTCRLHQWKWTLTPPLISQLSCCSSSLKKIPMAWVRQLYKWKNDARWCTLLCASLTLVGRLETMIGGWWFGLGLGSVVGATTHCRAVVGVFAVAPMRLDWLRQRHGGI